MEQIYEITNGVSEGLMYGLLESEKNQTLKSNGLTIIYYSNGRRRVSLNASKNEEFSRGIIKYKECCKKSSMEALVKELENGDHALGL